MSTPPNPATTGILTVLSSSSGYITLGLQLAGTFVPLVKGLISKIEGIDAGNVTITFTELLATDAAELDAIAKLSAEDLTAINAELARLGYPTLAAPAAPIDTPPPAATPPADPTPHD